MKVFKYAGCLIGLLLSCALFAQIGTSITLEGAMTVSEGGRAKAAGRATETAQGISGKFEIAFSQGDLVNLRLLNLSSYSVPGSTAFFGGTATATLRTNGRTRVVTGEIFVMVDDLDHDHLPFPDQFFMRFEGGGQTIIRHGLMTDGDIRVQLTT
jgi:hypothetical protein